MASPGFIIGFAGSINKRFDEKREKELAEENFLREQAMFMNKTLLPQYMERRQAEKAAASTTEQTGSWLATRGVPEGTIAAVFDADGAEGLVTLKDAIAKQGDLPPEEVAKMVKLYETNLPEGTTLSTLLSERQPASFEINEDFRLDTMYPELADAVYAPSQYSGTGGSVYAITDPDKNKPKELSITEQRAFTELVFAPATTPLVTEAQKQYDAAVTAGADEATSNAMFAAIQQAQAAVENKDYYGAVRALQSAQLAPKAFLADLAHTEPRVFDIIGIPPQDVAYNKQVYQAQTMLMQDLATLTDPAEQNAYVEAFVNANGPELLPPQIRTAWMTQQGTN